MDKQLTQGMPVHYWYSESKRTACGLIEVVLCWTGSGAYEYVDCEWCRRSLGWPDPVQFPNLSSHPNHVTNRD